MRHRPAVFVLLLGGLLLCLDAPASARPRSLYRWELGGHAVGMGLKAQGTPEPQGYGGVGLQARYRLRRRWGIELAGSVAHGELADGTRRDLVPLTGAVTFHLLPDSAFQLYGLAGAGLMSAYWSDQDGETIGASTSPMAQAGVGAMLDLGRLRLFGDLRGVAIFRQPPPVEEECGGGCGYRDDRHGPGSRPEPIGGTAVHLGAAIVW